MRLHQRTDREPSLKTYEKGAIVATFNTPSFLGQHGATITVVLDKPFYAEVQLHVNGYIRSDVVFDPGSVQFGEFEQGTTTKQKVTVNYAGRNDWKILDVRGTNNHLSVDLRETGRNGGQVSYEMTVHVDGNLPAGYVNDHLMLVTNDPQVDANPAAGRRARAARRHGQPLLVVHGRGAAGPESHQATGRQGKQALPHPLHHLRRQIVHLRQHADKTPKTLHLVPVCFVAGNTFGQGESDDQDRDRPGRIEPRAGGLRGSLGAVRQGSGFREASRRVYPGGASLRVATIYTIQVVNIALASPFRQQLAFLATAKSDTFPTVLILTSATRRLLG